MGKSPTSRRIITEPTAEGATRAATDLFKSIICEAVGQRDRCVVALAGGTTPHAMYQLLAEEAATGAVPWSKVEVFFGDERDVPHDHIESNFGMAQRTLLDHVPIDPSRVRPMRADADDLQAAAAEYERTIRRIVPAEKQGAPRFDLILLGMGADGHTASLFSCEPEALEEKEKLVVAHFVPVTGRNRMTITFPLINAARNVILLITGADKADAVAALLGDDAEARSRLPASRVNPSEGTLFLVLDAAAARLARP